MTTILKDYIGTNKTIVSYKNGTEIEINFTIPSLKGEDDERYAQRHASIVFATMKAVEGVKV